MIFGNILSGTIKTGKTAAYRPDVEKPFKIN
jgi:hypothetical protein